MTGFSNMAVCMTKNVYRCLPALSMYRAIATSQKRHRVLQKNLKLKGLKNVSKEWFIRQKKDPYVKRAHEEDFRCRSAFKLLEINAQYGILKPGDVVIDCGASPGSWCQVAVKKVNANEEDAEKEVGVVIGVDLKQVDPVEGAILFPFSDFTDKTVQNDIIETLNGRKVDVVLSDMSPNASASKQLDHEASVHLCASVLRFSANVLKSGGTLVCKLLAGQEQDKLISVIKKLFHGFKLVKPACSRSNSSEIYLLARDFHSVMYSKTNDTETIEK